MLNGEGMDGTLHASLASWANFYLVTGSAAAALTGLQFIVQTLLASEAIRPAVGDDPEAGIDAFGTPTVVHFTVALLVSAMMCMPWPGYQSLRASLAVVGVVALVYALVVLRRTTRQRSYTPVVEDWVWHVVLPGLAYAGMVGSAVAFAHSPGGALFPVAVATLILLCTGIHNAWDTVTYLSISAIRRLGPPPPPPPRPPAPASPATPRREKGKSRGRRR